MATHGVPLAGSLATVKPLRVARVKPVAYLRDELGFHRRYVPE